MGKITSAFILKCAKQQPDREDKTKPQCKALPEYKFSVSFKALAPGGGHSPEANNDGCSQPEIPTDSNTSDEQSCFSGSLTDWSEHTWIITGAVPC